MGIASVHNAFLGFFMKELSLDPESDSIEKIYRLKNLHYVKREKQI